MGTLIVISILATTILANVTAKNWIVASIYTVALILFMGFEALNERLKDIIKKENKQ